MGANKYEKFDIEIISRDQIQKADYNPRKITDKARKKLQAFLKANGLWSPLVWNKQTCNLVSGHQRITIMDALIRKPDYMLTVSVVDVDEATEVKGNIFFNNPSAQGDFDYEILGQIGELFPDIDFVKDLGFDTEEVEMFIDVDTPDFEITTSSDMVVEKTEPTEAERDEFREAKAKARDKAKTDNLDGDGYIMSNSDFALTVIFTSANQKRDFMLSLDEPPETKRITADTLAKLFKG